MELTEEKREEVLQESIPPMGFRMIAATAPAKRR